MTTAYYCVLIASLIPYGLILYAKTTPQFFRNNYNARPREYEEGLDGPRKRAYWAHLNGFESFPPFAAAVIIAHLCKVEQSSIDLLAISFVALRIVHGFVYIADLAIVRTLIWTCSTACTLGLFILASLS